MIIQALASERVGVPVGAAAITSPWWLPPLEFLSNTASLWLPIVGLIFLVVQMGFYFYEKFKLLKKNRK